MDFNLLTKTTDYIIAYTGKMVSDKRLKFYLPIIAVYVSLFFAFPSYDIVKTKEMADNWTAILNQVNNPFVPHNYNEVSHQANLSFRLTPVIMARVFFIRSIIGFLVMQLISLLLMFVFLFKLFNKITGDIIVSVFLIFSISFIFIGNVLCSDYRGFFDVVAFLFLILTVFSRNAILIILFSLLAYFTDERALITSGLIYLYFIVADTEDLTHLKFLKLDYKRISLLLSWLFYCTLRIWLSIHFGLKTNIKGVMDYLLNETIHQINILPFGIWTGLEGFWILILISTMILIKEKCWKFLFFFLAFIMFDVFTAIWLFDVTRSMAYLMPSIFVSLVVLSKKATINQVRYVALTILLLCLTPTYYAGGANQISWFYPFPLQLIRIIL
jgi:hypothetical protein